MLDPCLVEMLADRPVAEPLVERLGGALRVAPDRAQARGRREVVQPAHQRGADAAATGGREHCDPAYLAAVGDVEPPGAYGQASVVVGEDVQAQPIALVELDLLGNALLVD